MDLERWFNRSIAAPVKAHSSEILLGVGLTSGAAAIGLAILGTIKSIPLVEKKKEELSVKKLPVGEIVKTVWRAYIPTITMAALSTSCFIGSNRQSVQKIAALNTAYALSETALSEYKKHVSEEIGVTKEKEIQDAVDKEIIVKNPVVKQTIILTDGGDDLCYDSASGRYFRSSRDSLVSASNRLSRAMLEEIYVTLNEFYYEIGLDSIGVGEDLGWNIDDGLIELSFSSQVTADGTPCLVVNYYSGLKTNYK